ncbi:alpha/beta fold hydrolase [Sulfobacillus harzensis]|nr:alpha/beta hydrolase [Sulfobacillus harzensis]
MERTPSGLKYFVTGDGPEAVICHPSLGLGRFLFYRLIPSLSRRYQVFAYDPRGIGENAAMDPNLADWVGDVGELLDIAARPVHLIGVSLGTWVMSRAAVRWPQRVARLVLMGTTPGFENGPQDIESRRTELSQLGMERFARQYAENTLAPSTPSEIRDQLTEDLKTADPNRYLAAMAAIYLVGNREIFPQVLNDTLIVVGSLDQRTSPDMADAAARLIPNSQVRVVPDAGHLALLDQPERIEDLVLEFLATGRLVD